MERAKLNSVGLKGCGGVKMDNGRSVKTGKSAVVGYNLKL